MFPGKKPSTPQAAVREPKALLTNEKSTDQMADHASAWLGSGLHVKGDIIGTEDLLIDGSVEGRVQLDEWKVTLGPKAKLTADITARDVVVYGYVKGNIYAKGLVEIRKNGSVIGNLTTARIKIEDGANFKGSIEIDRSAPKESDTKVSSRAATASAGAGSISV
jgi:cytoskeletal protein CcmA (bactofilin family)